MVSCRSTIRAFPKGRREILLSSNKRAHRPVARGMNQPQQTAAKAQGIDLIPMIFLLLTPFVGIVGTAVYTAQHGFHLWMLLLALGMYAMVGLSITAGYHRFSSHKSYEAAPAVQRPNCRTSRQGAYFFLPVHANNTGTTTNLHCTVEAGRPVFDVHRQPVRPTAGAGRLYPVGRRGQHGQGRYPRGLRCRGRRAFRRSPASFPGCF